MSNTSLINGKYRLIRRIGGGSFGEIYMGVGPSGEKVAIKFERQGTRCPQLRHEFKVYRELASCHGFSNVYHFGTEDNYNVMVMDLLGPSLEDLFNRCSRRFSLKTVLQIADQLLERVDTLHSRHLIHRDIKPANFVIGLGENSANVYCVDFGLSKRYRHPKNLQHIPHRDGRSLTGTPRYASINNHLGTEQSRRDDLESVGYVLIYFLKGTLPWQGLKAKNAQKKYRMILEKKQQVSIAQLCQGCPSQFAEFLAYARSLKFDAKPDVPYLRKLFRDLYHSQGCASVGKLWDWDNLDMDWGPGAGGSAGGGGGGPSAGGPLPLSGPGPMMPSSGLLRPTTGLGGVGGGMEPDMLGGQSEVLMGASGGGMDDPMYDMRRPSPDMHSRPGTGEEWRQMQQRPGAPGVGGPLLGQVGTGNPSAPQPGILTRASGSAPASSTNWGYSRDVPSGGFSGAGPTLPTNPSGTSPSSNMNEYLDPQRRPHTAHAGSTMPSIVSNERRTSGSAVTEEEDGEGHVVAGARAMMRYRRTRPNDPPTGPSSGMAPSPSPNGGGVSGGGGYPSQQGGPSRSWTMDSGGGSAPSSGRGAGSGYPPQSGNPQQGQTRPSAPQQSPQQSQPQQSQQQQQRRTGPPQQGSSWLGQPQNYGTQGGGGVSDSRPRSAGVVGGAGGSMMNQQSTTRPTSGITPSTSGAPNTGANNMSIFSASNMRNRFISGGPGPQMAPQGSAPQQPTQTNNSSNNASSRRLFGLR